MSIGSRAGENSRWWASTSLCSVQQEHKKQAPSSAPTNTGPPRVSSPQPPLTFHPMKKIFWYQPSTRLNIPPNSPASLPADRTTTNGDTAQNRSPIAPEDCTPHLAICIETLAAYMQSMSQHQVSHSHPILTCDETERETQREADPWSP